MPTQLATQLAPFLANAIAGALFGAIFHLTDVWAIAVKLLCLAAVCASVRRSTHWRTALFIGWAWGAAATLTGMAWLYIAMHDIGGMPAAMAALALVLLALLLGVFNGVSAASAVWFKGRFQYATVPLIACWALGEWLRTWVLTGLPWMSVGYGFLDTPFVSAAPLLGVLGVGAAAVALASCLVLLLNQQRFQALLFGAVLLIAYVLAQTMVYTTPYGAPLSVALLQGNVPQTLKFDRLASHTYMQRYADLAASSTAQLTVMPETALTAVWDNLPSSVLNSLQKTPQTLLVGTIGQVGAQYTNRLATPYATVPWHYDKVHLVPFGEAIPTGFQWFVDMMRMPLSSLGRGEDTQTDLTVNGVRIAANICYEELFAHEWRARGSAAHILLNASNFGWYGDTAVFSQHTSIARMRALEFQKPYLSATNNGTTLAVQSNGDVQASIPKNTAGALTVTVQGMTGATPYALWGDWGMVGLALLLLAMARRRSGVR